jgi:hypothetical protein
MMADVSTISGSSSIATKPVPSPELPLFALVAADVAVVLADAKLADAELANADVAGDMLLDWLFVAPSPVPVSGKPPAMTGDAFNAAATIANFVSSWRILCPPSVTQCFFSAYDRKLRYFCAKSHETNTPQ